ncbi:hypothetical protein D3C87_1329730 [compost metagenome]
MTESAIPDDRPLQIVVAAGVAASIGRGLMVTVNLNGTPSHPFATGMMVYSTTAGRVVLLFVSVSLILPVPFVLNPDALPEVFVAVHLNVLPLTVEPGVNAATFPVQISCEASVPVLFG